MKLPIIVNEKGEPTAPNNFFNEHIIKAYAKRLEDRKAAGEKYNALIAELEHEVTLIHDADSANDFVSRIDAFEHIGNSKAVAGQLLAKQAKALNLVLNKQKKYESAKAEATA